MIEGGTLTKIIPAVSARRPPPSQDTLPEPLLSRFLRQQVSTIDLVIHRGLTAPLPQRTEALYDLQRRAKQQKFNTQLDLSTPFIDLLA